MLGFRKTKASPGKTSYAQCGEDLIVDFVLRGLRVAAPTYLDVGAAHPTDDSNTYLFYGRGGRGVCVEPNPALCPAFRALRPRDICRNAGVGPKHSADAEFYVLDVSTLSTFSKETAQALCQSGKHRIERVVKVPVLTIGEILSEHFAAAPDFISLDAEGMEMDILRGIDFARHRPKVFCVETLTYAENNTEKKQTETIEFMKQRGYFAYADTYINTIFVDREPWQKR